MILTRSHSEQVLNSWHKTCSDAWTERRGAACGAKAIVAVNGAIARRAVVGPVDATPYHSAASDDSARQGSRAVERDLFLRPVCAALLRGLVAPPIPSLPKPWPTRAKDCRRDPHRRLTTKAIAVALCVIP